MRLRIVWFSVAVNIFLLLLLPVIPSVLSTTPSASPVGITPSNVYTYESENFLVTVNDIGPASITSVSVTMPLGLELVGVDQNPGRVHLLTRNQSSYTAAWYGTISSGGILIRPGESASFGFSASVFGPGAYRLTVTVVYFDGSSESWQAPAVLVSSPSFLGAVDIRSLVYILGTIVILLPVGQSIALSALRRSHRGAVKGKREQEDAKGAWFTP